MTTFWQITCYDKCLPNRRDHKISSPPPWYLLRRRFLSKIPSKSFCPRLMTSVQVILSNDLDRLAYSLDRLAYRLDRFNWPLRQNYLGWFSKLLAGDFLAELYRRECCQKLRGKLFSGDISGDILRNDFSARW